jgi:CotS family spore coat protein
LKEYTGNEERLAAQNRLLTHLQGHEDVKVERIVSTREGSLYVKDNDGVMYLLKTYAEGRECNINDRGETLDSVRLLARLHSYMETQDTEGTLFSPGAEYEKRNRELKRVRKYLKQRSQKNWFEIRLQQTFDTFLEQALTVTREWEDYEAAQRAQNGQERRFSYCHGDYQYHNLLKTGDGWFVINFEKCVPDDPVRDLYLLMRKLLEKSNWSIALGEELLEAYEAARPLSAVSRTDLGYRLAYPEKFWKIVNFYYNSGKAWIPGRNLEKLEKLVEQQQEKQKFLDTLFRTS